MFDLKKTEARLNAREREDRLEAALELKAALDRGTCPGWPGWASATTTSTPSSPSPPTAPR